MNITKLKNIICLNEYKLNIGNYNFNIKSSQKLNLSNYGNIEINETLEQIELNIFLSDKIRIKEYFYSKCKNIKKSIPIDIEIFYSELSNIMKKQYSAGNIYNSFYTNGLENYYFFNYVTDDFCVYFKQNNNEIFIIGDENNLERVIIDFLTVSNIFLPLHAIAVAKNSKNINKDKITINLNLAKLLIKLKLIDKIEKYRFYKLTNVKKIQELKEPFPCISKNSFWCLDFIVKKNKKEYINNLINSSIVKWNNIIKKSEYLQIDFKDLDKFTDDFIKSTRRDRLDENIS